MACLRAEKNDSKSKTLYLEQLAENDIFCPSQEHESVAGGHQSVTDFHSLRSQCLAFKDSFMGIIHL